MYVYAYIYLNIYTHISTRDADAILLPTYDPGSHSIPLLRLKTNQVSFIQVCLKCQTPRVTVFGPRNYSMPFTAVKVRACGPSLSETVK